MNRTTIALVDRFVSFRFVSNRPQTTTNDLVPRVSSVSFRSVPLRPVPFRSVSFRSVSFLRVSRARAHTFFRFVTYSDTSVERRPRFVDQRIDARISTGFFVRSFVRSYLYRPINRDLLRETSENWKHSDGTDDFPDICIRFNDERGYILSFVDRLRLYLLLFRIEKLGSFSGDEQN